MPSPIAHASLALLATPALDRRATLRLWALVAAFLLLPDADIAVGLIASGDGFASHGSWSHSFLLAPIAGVAFALIVRRIADIPAKRAFFAGTALYASHVALDALTLGRGVGMLWPIVPERIESPIHIFSGVRHSEPGNIAAHLRTIAEESVFALWVALIALVLGALRKAPITRGEPAP